MDDNTLPQGSRLCQEAAGQILNIILTHLGNHTRTDSWESIYPISALFGYERRLQSFRPSSIPIQVDKKPSDSSAAIEGDNEEFPVRLKPHVRITVNSETVEPR